MAEIEKNNLLIEVNDNNFIIIAGEFDNELKFNILGKEIVGSKGVKNGKIIDLNESTEALKLGINRVEEKINFVFKRAYILLNQDDIDCINICGFKKLNGNQILYEDISYILNDLKNRINEVENNKAIIHLFNTEFILDKKLIENLPIGLYGNFYSHQLTFFLIKNDELNNLKKLLNNCNLNLNKIISKEFISGINLAKKEKSDTFLKIIIKKNNSQIIFFNNSAFNYYQNFKFGSDIILKDVSKVCSLSLSSINKIFEDVCFDKIDPGVINLDKKYFQDQQFKNIKLEYIKEIIDARIKEILNIIINKNSGLKNIVSKNIPIYLFFEDEKVFSNISQIFKKNMIDQNNLKIKKISNEQFETIKTSSELISRGWTREAIPMIQKKKSIISRIFSIFFD